MISLASSIIKNTVAPPLCFRFPVKLTYCIAFGSEVIVTYLNLFLSSYANR